MKERIARIFVFLLGVGLIIWTTYYKWAGLSTNSNFWGPGSAAGIGLGILLIMIALFTRVFCFYVAIWSLVGGVTLLAADNALYFSSPRLPWPVVQLMSKQAQEKYLNLHQRDINYANDGLVWFHRTGAAKSYWNGQSDISDELGYYNPSGYLLKKPSLDVLIFGDSFVEDGLPNFLRDLLAPATLYSLAVGGQGPPHWRLHFQRYINSRFYKHPPLLVVLNFYSGNDISDTQLYSLFPGVPENIKHPPAWPPRRFSFFGEIFSIFRNTVFPVLGSILGITPAVVSYQTEPDQRQPEWLAQWEQFTDSLTGMVSDIRANSAKTKILLVYQSTLVPLYAIDSDRCKKFVQQYNTRFGDRPDECALALNKQRNLSQLLSEYAQHHEVYYVDPTADLQAAGTISQVHLAGDTHLNPEGYRIYARAISRKITELQLLVEK